MTVQEGDIQITPKRGIQIRKFDDAASHGLTHCMKSVDFIMERRDKILFIEIKDPDNPQAGAANRDRFIGEFASGSIDADLVYKCRDSFLYEWASGGVQKPVHYYVLIAVEAEQRAFARRPDIKASFDEQIKVVHLPARLLRQRG